MFPTTCIASWYVTKYHVLLFIRALYSSTIASFHLGPSKVVLQMMTQKNLIYTQKEKEKKVQAFGLKILDLDWVCMMWIEMIDSKASKSLGTSFISKEKKNWSQESTNCNIEFYSFKRNILWLW